MAIISFVCVLFILVSIFQGWLKTQVSVIGSETTVNMRIEPQNDFNSCHYVEWHIQNSGYIPLHVDSVISSCECLDVTIDKGWILPNDFLTIKAEMHLENNINGKFYREIEVFGNFEEPLYLELQGEIIQSDNK